MMKKSKLLGLFSVGFLAVLLAGCFNPIEAILPKQDDLTIEPFTLDVLIGKDTEDGRSIAGPDAARIKGTGIRNIIQLIVVNSSGEIVAFDEVRRERDGEEAALLRIDSIAFGQTYHFLLLMGHWERKENAGDGTYQYTDDPPTLLAAGLKEQHITGSGKVTVTMWPIVVDTVFTAGDLTRAPVITGGKPGTVTLYPVDWDVTWTIKGGLMGNGLTDLVRAQKIRTADAGETLRLKSQKTLMRNEIGGEEWITADPADLFGNIITQSIKTYTSGFGRIGKEGSVNFNLEYVPFNLTEGAEWTPYDDDSVFDLNEKPPEWIIRNGVNDKAQDGETDFNAGNPGIETPNWNGAVQYEIAVKTPDDGSDLEIRDGRFVGPANSSTPEITFSTDGYDNTAGIYYAVVPKGRDTPDYSDYAWLEEVITGYHRKIITVEDDQKDRDYDVYVIVYKDGAVSDPLVINTRGGVDGDWIWGDEPYKSFYVASSGKDEDPGTKQQPLKTVSKALAVLAAEYAQDTSWPNKEDSDKANGGIIILDEVPVGEQITINNIEAIYPPIILRDEGTPGGKLLAQAASIGSGKSLLQLENNARVILDGGLILAGTGNSGDNIRGVTVTGASTFTMNGGKITGNSAILGGGVRVTEGSTFTMIGGEISGNTATLGGGGVDVNVESTFTMIDGKISGNTASSYAGGVDVTGGSTFTMNGGEISNNHSPMAGGVNVVFVLTTFTMNGGKIAGNSADYGAGVYTYGLFTMNGGGIVGNSASTSGGGVSVGDNSENREGQGQQGTFIMTAGEIAGNTASTSGGGVYIYDSSSGYYGKFKKTGGIIYGVDEYNSAKPDSKGNSGDAVWVGNDSSHLYRKAATSRSEDTLSYKYSSEEDISSGWDE